MEPHQGRGRRIGRADYDRQMLAPAIAGPECDQTGVFGVRERHPRFGDPCKGRILGMAAKHQGGIDRHEIVAPRQQCCFRGTDPDHQSGRQ